MQTSREDRIEEAWCRGLLAWKLHSGQEKIDNQFEASKGKLFIGNCSRRLGKTYWAACKAIERAIQVENAQIWYVSAFLNDLKKFIIPTFENILVDCPDEIKPEFKSTFKEWHFKNGSRIHLVGLDRNPDGIRGNYADLVVFEEAGLISRLSYLYSGVVMPMTMYRDNAKVVMISTPPETPAHDFQDFCERAKLNDAYIKLTIYDNPLLTEEMIKEIKDECLNPEDFEREYMCEFVVDSNRAIVREWQGIFEVAAPKPEYYEYCHRYVSMDLGVKDMTAVLFGYYDFPKGQMVVEREADIHGPDMTTDKLARLVQGIEYDMWHGVCTCNECSIALHDHTLQHPTPTPPMLISHNDNKDGLHANEKPLIKPHRLFPVYRRVADNNNPLLLQDLGLLHNIHFTPTGKDNLDAMVNELRFFISQGRLLVHPSCKKLIGSIKYGIWDKQRKGFARSRVYGHFDHLAALIYLIRNIDQHTDPIPKGVGIHKDTHHITLPIGKYISPATSTFKKIFGINK